MPTVDVVVSCPIFDSFRVQQVAGLFDLPAAEKGQERFSAEIPDLEADWRIGLVLGPSGSGKSTIAKRLFGDCLYGGAAWPEDRALVDCLGDRPIKEIIGILTAVGLSSPPSWIKPYHVLSCGERFRCDFARAILKARAKTVDGDCKCRLSLRACEKMGTGSAALCVRPGESRQREVPVPIFSQALRENRATFAERKATKHKPPEGGTPAAAERQRLPVVCFDEFTSVVDRNVARTASAAIAKAARRGLLCTRFVAVTCHDDVEEWLEPDWTLDMATGKVAGRRLRRPPIRLEIVRSKREAWRLFARHHYLSGSLCAMTECFLGLWNGDPVSFCGLTGVYGHKGQKRVTRVVTLPDFQGIGIGGAMLRGVAEIQRRRGFVTRITTSHPAMIAHLKQSADWEATGVARYGKRLSDTFKSPWASGSRASIRSSLGRCVASFRYRCQLSVDS